MERYGRVRLGRVRLGGRLILAAVWLAGIVSTTSCSPQSPTGAGTAAGTAAGRRVAAGPGTATPDLAAVAAAAVAAGGPSKSDNPLRRPVLLPQDEAVPPAAACATTPRPAGWVARENRRPGNRGWRPGDDRRTTIKAYLGQVSAVCGETVDLHLAGYAPLASATAYRIGWYGGLGAREVWSAAGLPVAQHDVVHSGPPQYMVEASWPALKIRITPDWTPGFYVLDVRGPGETVGGEAVPFVVRDASGPRGSGTSPLLFQAAVLTYQAYNAFDHYSMYGGPADKSPAAADRTRVASFDRPYAGSGYQAPFLYDAPLAEEIERLGLDVDYTTDVDVDRRPAQVVAHKALIIGGHSEYWTRRMYDAAEYARNRGVNLAFFGANTVYWHTRLEPSPTGPDRRMAVYRRVEEDPLAASDAAQATVQWRTPPLDRPESGLVGADFGSYNTVGGGFRVLEPTSWIFAGTGVTAGQTLPGSLAGEFDTVRFDDRQTPADIDVIAAAPVSLFGRATMATMSYYTSSAGSGVFSAGTTYWPCEVIGDCQGYPVNPEVSRVFGTMTENLLRSFAAGPAGQAHPSQRHLAPTAAGLVASAASPRDVAVRSR